MAYEIRSNGLKVKTSDGKTVMGADYNVEIKELDEKNRSFWAVASTETPDRDNDVIRTEGWDYKNYIKNNPVGLFAHDYWSNPQFKTGKIKLDKENKLMLFQPIFDTFDKAEITWNQYKNGFLNSFSVGFNPLEHKYIDENSWYSGIEFLKQELLEISAVPVPANKEANILRSMATDINHLAKLGYSQEIKKDDNSGVLWYPIKDMESYKEPRITNIGNGIKAVSGIPLFETKDSSIIPVVGYFFDLTLYDEKLIQEWMKKNCPKITNKFFTFKEDKGIISLEIKEEIKNIEDINKDENNERKEETEKDSGTNSTEENTSGSEETSEGKGNKVEEESEEASEEEGCGGGKKPKKSDENFDKSMEILVLTIKELKASVLSLKDIVSDLNKQSTQEENKENFKSEVTEDSIELDESSFPVAFNEDSTVELDIEGLEKLIPDIKSEMDKNFQNIINEIAKQSLEEN